MHHVLNVPAPSPIFLPIMGDGTGDIMRLDPKSMKRRQHPRVRGSWVCEFRGLGVLPVLHARFLNMTARRYSQAGKFDGHARRLEELLEAFDNPRALVAIQADHPVDDGGGFKQWWGVLKFADLDLSDDGTLSFTVVDRLTEWPA